jgi:predicted secreted hydrolase
LRFPRAHFGHPRSSIEWWYFSALVHDAAGTPYSVFFTLFSSGGALVPIAQVRNLHTGAVVGQSEALAAGAVSTSAVDVNAGGAQLRFDPRANVWELAVSGPSLDLSLRQRPLKRYVLHGGGTGVIRQSLAGVSHYYSATRMRAEGTVVVGGKPDAITGEGWFDHQWGNFRDDPRAFDWDWFSCRFADRTELMLYRFRDRRTGRPLGRFANGTYVGRIGRTVAIRRFRATAGPRTLDAAGHEWPLDWQLAVPKLHLSERLRSVAPDQLVRSTILPTFWEGVADATGSRRGPCFVELSYR